MTLTFGFHLVPFAYLKTGTALILPSHKQRTTLPVSTLWHHSHDASALMRYGGLFGGGGGWWMLVRPSGVRRLVVRWAGNNVSKKYTVSIFRRNSLELTDYAASSEPRSTVRSESCCALMKGVGCDVPASFSSSTAVTLCGKDVHYFLGLLYAMLQDRYFSLAPTCAMILMDSATWSQKCPSTCYRQVQTVVSHFFRCLTLSLFNEFSQ
jgi:hypothetical protein